MRIFGEITINNIVGTVVVADSFIEDGDLKSEIAIEFDSNLTNETIERLTSAKCAATLTIENVCKDKEVEVYSDCDYASGNIARVFVVIEDYKKQLGINDV